MESAELILVLLGQLLPCDTGGRGASVSGHVSWPPPCWCGASLTSSPPPPPPVPGPHAPCGGAERQDRTGPGGAGTGHPLCTAPGRPGRRPMGSCSPTPARRRRPPGRWSGWRAPRLDCPPASPRTPCLPTWRRPSPPWGSSPAPPCGRTSPTGSSSVSALENKRSARTFRSAQTVEKRHKCLFSTSCMACGTRFLSK